MIRLFAFTLLTLAFLSCSPKKELITNHKNTLVNHLHTETNKQHHVGFILKDLESNKVIFEHNADKNFIAASNIKLLTFYAGLQMLGDSVPSIQYTIRGDSLLVWPMADPTFLHASFKSQKAFDFLKNSGKNIFIVSGRYKGEKYGKGWAWDDYNESFQAEITEFPLYGNVMHCKRDSAGGLMFSPDLSSLYFSELTVKKSALNVKRNIDGNDMDIPEAIKPGYQQTVPIHFNNSLLESLLTDTLLATGLITTSVTTLPWRAVPADAETIYSNKTKDVLEKMLKNSDNFIAEQMLLNYAAANKLEMNGKTVINKASQYLPEILSSGQWIDGSGLSRLNLVSPKLIVDVLEKIKTKISNEQKLLSYLSAGGMSGTLKNMFISQPQTFIYGKSGSLANNYNLSGYLIGKSGKRYAFSYLNNNYLRPTKEIKAEVEKFLIAVYEQY